MSLPSFTCTSPVNLKTGPLTALLSDTEMRHVRAARIRPGEHILLRDSEGHGVEAVFEACTERGLRADACRVLQREKIVDFTLVCAVSKGERMSLTLRAATELGVRNIIPVITARTVVRLDDGPKTQAKARHWAGIVQSAVQQSSRLVSPVLGSITNMEAVRSLVSSYDLFLIAWEQAGSGDIEQSVKAAAGERGVKPADLRVALLVGPEGGLEEEEVGSLVRSGAKTVTLGNSILRCETACIVGCAFALHAMSGQ